MSLTVQTTPLVFLFSKAHSCFAASICRRLLMQALSGPTRAGFKFGITIAQTKRPSSPRIIDQTRIFDLDDDLFSDSSMQFV